MSPSNPVRRRSTGASPKTTSNPVHKTPPAAGQLSAWGFDPSIITSGRASVPTAYNAAPTSVFQSFVERAITGQSAGVPTRNLSASQYLGNQASGFQPENLNFPPPFVAPEEPAAQAVAQVRNRPGLTHTVSKWTVRFGGNAKDLAIDEFFFRVENMAAADNVHADSLVLGLHCLITGNASDFYWVQRRKYPNHAWGALKRAMLAHFAKQEADLEIRKLIMERRQATNEGFGEFSLAVECLATRLIRPMANGELMEILRQNMSANFQTCLLMHPTHNVDALKGACRKYERLWASQMESQKGRNFNRRMAELGFEETPPQVDELRGRTVNTMASEELVNEKGFEVNAIAPAKAFNRAEYAICWNCEDIGHTFVDCTSTDRKVFCYGCGAKNIYKPTCPKCSPENPRSSGTNSGRPRSNLFALNRPGHPLN